MKSMILLITVLLCLGSGRAQQSATEIYKCVPCGRDCDGETYTSPGTCPHCGMELVKASTIHFATVAPGEVCNYIAQHPNTVLLDVRTKEEYDGKANPDYGTLKGAINIPIQELPNRLTELASYKNKEILVYCSHSHRSSRASYLLTQNGFMHIVNMAGGMSVLTDSKCKR
jgi:rhodanese-related sulfurtransferase/DNA-directed RNA polymerase subunit RPC12/RpoP